MNINYWKRDTAEYAGLFGVGLPDSPYAQILIPTILKSILEKTTSKDKILDVGCGEGYLTRKIQELKRNVDGCEISKNLICIAKQKNDSIQYFQCDIEQLQYYTRNKYHFIIANLVLMYILHLDKALKNINKLLYKKGYLLVSITHPCFNQESNDSWFINNSDEDLIIKDYLRENIFLKRIAGIFKTHHFHRTLSTYTKYFINSGFSIIEILEPRIGGKKKSIILEKARKIPFFIIFILQKNG